MTGRCRCGGALKGGKEGERQARQDGLRSGRQFGLEGAGWSGGRRDWSNGDGNSGVGGGG